MRLYEPYTKPEACAGCPRAAHGRGFVPGEGHERPALVVIGEQPGENEVVEGKPFVGKSGKVLNAGLGGPEARSGVYVTNVRKCLGAKGESKEDRAASIAHCAAAYLQKELDFCRPRAILAVGSDAAAVLAGRGDVSKIHGSVYTREEAEAMLAEGGEEWRARERD